jgi:uncharacterized membrane protein
MPASLPPSDIRVRPAPDASQACGWYNERVGRRAGVVLYVVAMVAIIVVVDVLFLRHQFWPRLLVNIAVVVVFLGFYLWFRKARPQDQ